MCQRMRWSVFAALLGVCWLGIGLGSAQPTPSVMDPCLQYATCSTCVENPTCLWCLSQTTHPCRSRSACPVTGYTDCCVLLKTCATCSQSATCGYCSDTNLCITGNVTTPRGTTCKAWYYSTCPDPNKNPNLPIILVIMLTVGCGVVLLSIILLILFIRRIIRQQRARRDMNEYYKAPTRAVCDFCQDGLATVICKQCKLYLCDYCKTSEDLHPAGVHHTLEPLEYSIQDDDPQQLSHDNAYTSFAGLLSKSSSMRSYGSNA